MTIKLRLTGNALVQLLGEDEDLRVLIAREAVDELAEHHAQRLSEQIIARITAGLDLEGRQMAWDELRPRLEEKIKTEVGNYLRCQDAEIRRQVQAEVERQAPGQIRWAVQCALEAAAKRVLAEGERD